MISSALAEAQAEDSSARLVADIWPQLDPAVLIRLDQADASLMLQCSGISASFEHELAKCCFRAAEQHFAAEAATNPYFRGGRLRTFVRQEVTSRWDRIRRRVDELFEARQADSFASRRRALELTIGRLSDRCLDELLAWGGGNDDIPKRHLKILTALVTPGGTRAYRDGMFECLTSGRTAAFPYIIKYLNRGIPPAPPTLPRSDGFNVQGFTNDLMNTFPELVHVRNCLQNFSTRQGILQHFLPPDAPIADQNWERFAALPAFVPREEGGLILPREIALQENRRDRYRLPDGAICCVGLGITLESLLFQLRQTLNLGGPQNARGNELLRRLMVNTQLRDVTVDRLRAVFSEDSLSFRDALAHSAFFANDETRVEEMVSGLSWALADLVQDLQTAGINPVPPRWDVGHQLANNDQLAFEQQSRGRLNLVNNENVLEMRRLVFQVLNRLAPDKALLGKCSLILWNEHQGQVAQGVIPDPTAGFVGLLSGLITLEELFRAVAEQHNLDVLHVTRDGQNRVRCELSILDDRPGRLLGAAVLNRVFGADAAEQAFQDAVRAVRNVRDLLLHGSWHVLGSPPVLYSHLVMKLIFALCCSVQ